MGSGAREPGWAASWALAIAVHAIFFAFLYFGLSWRPKLQPPLTAELWSELPPVRQAPARPRVEPAPEPPPPPPKVEKPPEPTRVEPKPEPPAPAAKAAPPAPSKADIELKERTRKLQEQKLQEKKAAEEERRRQALERKEEEKREREEQKRLKEEARAQEAQRKRDEQARAEAQRREEERRTEQARREQEARLEREAEARRVAILDEQQKLAAVARERAAVEAKQRREAEEATARARELEAWKTRIHDRIKSKLVLPPGVPDSARAEYNMTIIPGGEVLAVKLRRTSGFPAYDAAIERAITAAAPLPVPSDPELFQQMRELNLVFRAN